jgi:putative phosphonate metabolism protein
MGARSAIYFAPQPGSALEAFGCGWLGRTLDGAPLPQPAVPGIDPTRLIEITNSPRHYGFHGTLKAPFALAAGNGPRELNAAVEAFARGRAAFDVRLRVGSLGGFIALVPQAPSATLDALAADCVEAFDRFRAPLDESEIARRRAAGLTPRQDRNLLRYGYPYVLDDFRFHMTLTERLEPPERDRVLALLAERAAPVCATPLAIDAIAIFEQPARDAPFVLRRRFAFGREESSSRPCKPAPVVLGLGR